MACSRGRRRGVHLGAFVAGLVISLGLAPAQAQNIARGQTLYFSTNGAPKSCGSSNCHDGFPTTRKNKINNGTNPTTITNAISRNTGNMGILSGFVSAQDAADIAAYIANPAGASAPAITRTPTSLTFASQAAGTTSASSTVTVSNSGGGSLTLSGLSLAGTNASEFVIAAGGTCTAGSSLAAGANCTIKVAFSPTGSGAKTATLSIAHNATGSPSSVSLSGTAAAATPTISLSATSLSFPSTPVGSSNSLPAVILTNSGSAALNISGLTLGGTNAGDFTLAGTCAVGTTVAAGSSCTLALSFSPMATGARSASLSITSNNSGGTVALSLTGSGVNNTPAATLSANSLAFGSQQVGTTSATRSITVTNTGGGQLGVTAVTTSAPFSASGSCAGASLSNNQSCTVSVTFAPASAGTATGSLTITHSAAGSPSSIVLTGTGSATPVAAVSLSRSSLAFAGVIAVGQSSLPERVSFSNAGPGSVTISAMTASADFSVVTASGGCANGQVIAAGSSCTIDLSFSPGTAGARAGTLTVSSNGSPSDATAMLSGTGSAVAAPALAPAPTQVNFGRLSAGDPAASQTVALINSGSTNLVVNALSATGSPFGVASGGTCGSPPFALAPGSGCTVTVTFASVGTGVVSGALMVTTNSSPATVDLVGEVSGPTAISGTTSATNVGLGGGGALGGWALIWLGLALILSIWMRAPGLRAPD